MENLTVGAMLEFLTKSIAEGRANLTDELIAHDNRGNSFFVSPQILSKTVSSKVSGYVCVGTTKPNTFK